MSERTPPQVVVGGGYLHDEELPQRRDYPFRSYAAWGGWYNKVREMRREPTIKLARALSIAPILAAPWSFEKEKNAPEGALEDMQRQLMPQRMNIMRTMMCGCTDYGWQGYEKIIDFDEYGRIVLKKLKPLLQDFTKILVDKNTGDFVGLRQRYPHEATPLDLCVDECLLVSIDVEGTDWYGEALMKSAEIPFDQGCDVEQSASRYDRKIAGAHWVVYYPLGNSNINGQTLDNAQVATLILNKLESSGSVAIPNTVSQIVDTLSAQAADKLAWKIELLTAQGGTTPFIERLKYIDAKKARAFGMPERAILEGQFGTKAEAEAHGDFAIVNMELRAKIGIQHLNRHVVDHLLRLNYGKSAEGSVYIQQAPLVDAQLMYLREVYTALLADPTTMMTELAAIDFEAFRDRLGVPQKPNAQGDEVPADLSSLRDTILTMMGEDTSPQIFDPLAGLEVPNLGLALSH